jgi:ubiquitin-conjugating enzyme E2 J1
MRNCGSLRGVCALVRVWLVTECSSRRAESGNYVAIIGLQGFFPLKGQAAMGVGALEVPSSERKRLAALYVSHGIMSLFSITHFECSRSRDWVCPSCNQSNLECLPDPPRPDDAASGSASEVKTSSEAEEVIPTPTEAVPAQSAESEVYVPTQVAAPDGADGASEQERNEVTTPVTASSPPSAITPLLNPPGVRGAREGTASAFHPSHAPATVHPPMLLDTAICVLLVLVFALLCRRIF